ncbi:MAG: diaminopimelate decarboxylase, partial [Ekhidna sp.]
MENASLIQAASTYGSPLYIYDANQMKENYKQFIEAFKVSKLKVHYACKALNNQAVLKLFKSLGAGLDCVSIEEVHLGLHAGYPADDILFTPNNISTEEYEAAIDL